MKTRRPISTATRRHLAQSQDRAVKRLTAKGWKHDGLWWINPTSGLRYAQREALAIEEIRCWGESDSAFLNDKDHSMWVKKEIEDNALISWDELEKQSKKRADIKRRALSGCYGKET